MNTCCCILEDIYYYFKDLWNKHLSCRKRPKRSIVILVAGLDNAGKSAIVNYIFSKSLITEENVVPTIGFRTVSFKYQSCTIRLYDVGGGPQIRALWPKYYADVHGVIYVVDSSDLERLYESADVFQELICHELISQKPILFLGNKQDVQSALNELDLIECMNIEHIVNFVKCYTRVEICSVYPDKRKKYNLNKNVDIGFKWLIETICEYYDAIETEMQKRIAKRKCRRSFNLKSWAAPRARNSFEYSDTDSETYMKPIVPDDTPPRKPKKRRSLRSIFSIANNRTAPAADGTSDEAGGAPTTETMKELIRNIRIEDLVRNAAIEPASLSEHERRKRYRKRRPGTAPAALKQLAANPIRSAEPIVQDL